MTWDVAKFREDCNAALAAGELTEHKHVLCMGIAWFCERRKVRPASGNADLFGFGRVEVHYEDLDGPGWWTYLHLLPEPTGMTYSELLAEWEDERSGDLEGPPDVDEVTWTHPGGETNTLKVVHSNMIFRLFMGPSPWAMEFAANFLPAFRLAAINSGIGDVIKGQVLVDNDKGEAKYVGERTLTELITEQGPIPSRDVAERQAMSGPAGALEREDWS